MRNRPKRIIRQNKLNDFYYPQNSRKRNQRVTQRDAREESRKKTEVRNDSDRERSPVRVNQRDIPVQNFPSPPNQAVASKQTATTQTVTTMSPKRTPQEKLEKLYTDPDFPTAYSAGLKKFLQEKTSLSRHKQIQRRFKRRKTLVYGPYTTLQADTIFYRNYARQNHGYKYILVVIDCFSRKNWVRPMKSTTAEETASCLDEILESMPYKPTQFASDQGNEFNSKHPAIFNTLIVKYGLIMYTLKHPIKAGIAERFIRTLKTRIERYFTEHNTVKWVDILQELSDDINNSFHRTIGMAPNDVTFENRREIFRRLYGSSAPPIKCKFRLGDRVRIPIKKDIFDKGYTPNWSEEIYTIADKRSDGEVCYYQIKEDSGDILEKRFYEQELNLVIRNEVS